MPDQVIKATTTFYGHFRIVGEEGRISWREIREGTEGILTEEYDRRMVSFALGCNEMVSAYVFEGEGINAKTTLVHPDLFVIV